jgi:hypothetical protein
METATQQQTDGNRLIAEFMGFVPDNNGFYDGWELKKAGLPFACGAMGNGTRYLRFHLSWDWLMPVVAKIEQLGYDFCIADKSVFIRREYDYWEVYKNANKIQAVWTAIVDFAGTNKTQH